MEKKEITLLEKARIYEKQGQAQIPAGQRPLFHLTPPVGWLNDPNGFSLYQGEYHLFYQYHPYAAVWGPMHWGHSKTRDFLHWEMLPCALAPDMEYDAQGCFSGSAVEEGKDHILMYTSVRETALADGSRQVRQTQSIAVGDGRDYRKLSCNPVITADMLPEGSSQEDFRDPKLWKEGERFYALAASRHPDGSGQLALFSSGDLREWKFESILDRSGNRCGRMWECPDFFPLEDRYVLVVSPQSMRAEGLEFHNGDNAVYFVGSYDKEAGKFDRGAAHSLDYGLDFYAPQTTRAADGRRILVGWAQSWDNYLTPEGQKWSGMMSIPRELSLKDGRLLQRPVRELEACRAGRVSHLVTHQEPGNLRLELDRVSGRVFDLELKLHVSEAGGLRVHLASNEEYDTVAEYDAARGILTIDRTYCGMRKDLVCRRSMYAPPEDGLLKLRFLMDKYCLEIFVNDGAGVMTSLIYTPLEADRIWFESTGKISFDVEKYELNL